MNSMHYSFQQIKILKKNSLSPPLFLFIHLSISVLVSISIAFSPVSKEKEGGKLMRRGTGT